MSNVVAFPRLHVAPTVHFRDENIERHRRLQMALFLQDFFEDFGKSYGTQRCWQVLDEYTDRGLEI